MFRDREEAGYELAKRLIKYKNSKGVVLAVPKGGVPIAYIVANELELPMELVLSKKIGHPLNKEYAIGAVSLLGSFVIPHEGVTQHYIDKETARIQASLKEMQKKFMSGDIPESLKGKTVIIIDDGIATGNTLLATINILKKHEPEKLVIAVPVSSRSAYEKLSTEVDELIAIMTPEYFAGVGAYYEQFEDVGEQEVQFFLNKIREKTKAVKK